MLFHLDAPERPSPVVVALHCAAEIVKTGIEGGFEGSQVE
jgi:hypothetical protein